MGKENDTKSKRIPKAIIEKIKSRIDIVDFVSSKQEMKFQGENYHSSCPICKSKTSFVVYPKSQSFYCFACANGGDIITYVMRTEDKEYIEAVKELALFADIDMADNNSVVNGNLMRDAAFYYHTQLRDNPKAKSAIDHLHSWGIQGKTIVQLGIGFHDDSFNSFIGYMTKQKSYSAEDLEEAKLVLKSSKGTLFDKMRNSIIIPTIDKDGNVVCFDFYVLDKEQNFKYPNTNFFQRSENLYSYNLAIKSGKQSVIIVSSYEDYFMEMKTLNPIILKELIEKIEVYHVEGSGKNKTQRIIIHYRFVGCLTIPEWYRKRRVSLESRSGVEINFLTTAV